MRLKREDLKPLHPDSIKLPVPFWFYSISNDAVSFFSAYSVTRNSVPHFKLVHWRLPLNFLLMYAPDPFDCRRMKCINPYPDSFSLGIKSVIRLNLPGYHSLHFVHLLYLMRPISIQSIRRILHTSSTYSPIAFSALFPLGFLKTADHLQNWKQIKSCFIIRPRSLMPIG